MIFDAIISRIYLKYMYIVYYVWSTYVFCNTCYCFQVHQNTCLAWRIYPSIPIYPGPLPFCTGSAQIWLCCTDKWMVCWGTQAQCWWCFLCSTPLFSVANSCRSELSTTKQCSFYTYEWKKPSKNKGFI